MARPFSPSSSLSPATADALAASPLSTLPLAHRIPSQNSPGFSFSIELHHPPLPPFRFLPRSFQDFLFLQPIGATFRFTLFDAFSQLLLFTFFSSSFFYVISRSVLFNHPSLFPSCPSFVSLIDESPYTEKISELYLSIEFLFFFFFTFPFDPSPFSRHKPRSN